MNTRSRLYKRSLAFLCVALILACALTLFLPHTHFHTADTDCEVCAIIDQLRNLLIAIMLLVAIGHHTPCVAFTLWTYAYVASGNKATLVGQKVKLSN